MAAMMQSMSQGQIGDPDNPGGILPREPTGGQENETRDFLFFSAIEFHLRD